MRKKYIWLKIFSVILAAVVLMVNVPSLGVIASNSGDQTLDITAADENSLVSESDSDTLDIDDDTISESDSSEQEIEEDTADEVLQPPEKDAENEHIEEGVAEEDLQPSDSDSGDKDSEEGAAGDILEKTEPDADIKEDKGDTEISVSSSQPARSTSPYLLIEYTQGSGYFNNLAINFNGKEYPAFCIDPYVDINISYPDYVNGITLSPAQAAKIETILNNAYPVLTEHQLSVLWGVSEIGADEAYDITQCALWYVISNGGHVIPDDLLSVDGYKIYSKLISGENRAPRSVDVKIEASSAETKYTPKGCIYGPIRIVGDTVSSGINADMNGTGVDVTRGAGDSEYMFVDADGNEVNELVVGTEYWIKYADSGIFNANLEFVPTYHMQKVKEFIQLTSVLGADTAQSIGMLTTAMVPVNACLFDLKRDTTENSIAVKKEIILKDNSNILLSDSGKWADKLQIGDALVSAIEVELYKWNGAAWTSTGQVKTISFTGSWANIHNESKDGVTEFSGLVEGEKYLLYERWLQRAISTDNVTETAGTQGERIVKTTTYGYTASTSAELSANSTVSAVTAKDVTVNGSGIYSAAGDKTAKGVEFTYSADMDHIKFINAVECSKTENTVVYRGELDLSISKTSDGADPGPYTMYLYESTGVNTWVLVQTVSVSSDSLSTVTVKPDTKYLLIEEFENYHDAGYSGQWYLSEKQDTYVDDAQNLITAVKDTIYVTDYTPGQAMLTYTPTYHATGSKRTYPAIYFETSSGDQADPSLSVRNYFKSDEIWAGNPYESIYVSTRYIENGIYNTAETFAYSDSGVDNQGKNVDAKAFSEQSNNTYSSNRYEALLGYWGSDYWNLRDYYLESLWENGVSIVRETVYPGVTRVTTTTKTTKLNGINISDSVSGGMEVETVYLDADTKQEISGELPDKYLTSFKLTGMDTSVDGRERPYAYIRVLHEKMEVVTYESTIGSGMGIGVILKKDAMTYETLYGATFDIINKATGEVIVEDWTASELYTVIEGYPSFATPVLPNGTYILREKIPPFNYELSPHTGGNDTEIVINGVPTMESEIIAILNYMEDTLKPWERPVTFRKLNQLGNVILGAKFNIYSKTLNRSYEVDLSSEPSATLILPLGEYLLTETERPEGVKESIEPISFTVDDASPPVVAIDVENCQESGFYLFKHDRKNADVSLSGAVFEIWTTDDDPVLVAEITTGDAKSYISGLPLGTYRIIETKVPDGFLDYKREYTVTIDSLDIKTIHIFNDNTPIDYGRLEVQKKNDKGVNIGPAAFELYDAAGLLLDTLVTDDNGYYLSDFLPVSEYKLLEISAPYGYTVSTDGIFVTVEKDSTAHLEPVNLPDAGYFEIQKKNGNGDNIGPATFELYDSDGNMIETITTSDTGYYRSDRLQSGHYSLVEVFAPIDHILDANPISLTISFQNNTRVWPVNYPIPATPENPDNPDTPDIPDNPDTTVDPPTKPPGPSGNTPDPKPPKPSKPKGDRPHDKTPQQEVVTSVPDIPPTIIDNVPKDNPKMGRDTNGIFLAYMGLALSLSGMILLRRKEY